MSPHASAFRADTGTRERERTTTRSRLRGIVARKSEIEQFVRGARLVYVRTRGGRCDDPLSHSMEITPFAGSGLSTSLRSSRPSHAYVLRPRDGRECKNSDTLRGSVASTYIRKRVLGFFYLLFCSDRKIVLNLQQRQEISVGSGLGSEGVLVTSKVCFRSTDKIFLTSRLSASTPVPLSRETLGETR